MSNRTIAELLSARITGEWGEEAVNGDGVAILRTTNFTNEGVINYESVVKRRVDSHLVQKKKLRIGDIIIEKSGGGPKQPVGRVVYFDLNSSEPYLCNNFTTVLRPKENVHPKYFFYALFAKHLSQATLRYQNKTTGIINLKLERYLANETIPLPDLPTQRKIAHILEQADAARQKRKQALALTEQFLQSAFLEMFGDPVTNEKGWEVRKFGELCDDLRYGTSVQCSLIPNDRAFPVLRIPNVVGGYINQSDLKYANVASDEADKLRLKKGDILFVRSNGNPEYIGRCAVFNTEREFLYASYLIRARLRDFKTIAPIFLNFLFLLPSYRTQMVSKAKTTAGNYNINTVGLRSLNVILPPISLQEEFIALVERVEQLREKQRESEWELENLFGSLLQRWFG